MMPFLYTLHGHNRWLVVLSFLLLVGRLAQIWLQKKTWTKQDTLLLVVFSSLLTVQFIIGLSNLWFVGTANEWNMKALRLAMEHTVTMTIALGISHSTMRFKKLESVQRAQKTLVMIMLTGLLIFVGVARLRGVAYWFSGSKTTQSEVTPSVSPETIPQTTPQER